MGVGNWYGLRKLATEPVFSNLSEALFGGTRAFAHTSFPPPSFRDSVYRNKADFLSRMDTRSCGMLDVVGKNV